MVQPPVEGEPVPREFVEGTTIGGLMTLLLVIPGMGMSVIAHNPVTDMYRQTLNEIIPVAIPDPTTAITMRLKGQLDDAGYKQIMVRQGFSHDIAERILNAAETILTPAELINANFRGIIDDGRYSQEMARLGFGPESADHFKEVSRFVAGPTDLVRFAVREVFTPEIVAELGLADEFPSEFVEAVSTWGMDEKTAEDFWKAHWILPSIQQGFAMLHRRVEKPDGARQRG